MEQNELVGLIEQNIINLHYLGLALRADADAMSEYTRQQTFMMVRLYVGGRAKLKDIAKREFTTVPNLCAMFRKLERDGMILRESDPKDRRNAYYVVTDKGAELCKKIHARFRNDISEMIYSARLDDKDTKRLLDASRTTCEMLSRLDRNNAYNFTK
jgi:DNA-binding MarR family transcriptional regulator